MPLYNLFFILCFMATDVADSAFIWYRRPVINHGHGKLNFFQNEQLCVKQAFCGHKDFIVSFLGSVGGSAAFLRSTSIKILHPIHPRSALKWRNRLQQTSKKSNKKLTMSKIMIKTIYWKLVLTYTKLCKALFSCTTLTILIDLFFYIYFWFF